MLDLEEINNTIETLLNGSTTFDNVSKLASLYIVKERLENVCMSPLDVSESVIENELDDILPAYRKYVDIKREYQLQNVDKTQVINQFSNFCYEISEFIHTVYNNTECEECRNLLIATLKSLDL